ncbi:acyltransferase [Hyphomicrobium sp.]|uniref:acyltransferase family protein n=1 Tax=Hyphomicrobium sp. TaxID=82 RepID=UPI001D78D289|nr:acyltransferase [Hyphomicrobium sp.]MBY0562252.1 acyltransferase [Hyphomicrobium sp.]
MTKATSIGVWDAGRFAMIDGLRGIAALAVFLYHCNEGHHLTNLMAAAPAWFEWIVRQGHLGIAIFFVLSGFVISHSLRPYSVTAPVVARFLLRRSVRLDPPYWFAIALTIGMAALSAHVVQGKEPLSISMGQLVAHVFYLQEALGFREIGPIFWTLCQEVQFYLIYALLLAATRNDPARSMQGGATAIGVAVAALISLLWPLGIVTWEPWRGSFLPLWHCFLLGAGAYWMWQYPQMAVYYFSYVAILTLSAAFKLDEVTLAAGLTAMTLWYATTTGGIYRWFSWRWLQFLGLISYSLYLTHNPVSGALFRIGYGLTGRSALTEAFWWAMVILGCILFSAGMWWLIERLSLALAKRINLVAKKPASSPLLLADAARTE